MSGEMEMSRCSCFIIAELIHLHLSDYGTLQMLYLLQHELNFTPIHGVKWRHSNLPYGQYGHDTIPMSYLIKGPYCAKLAGEDFLRYLNKTELVGLRKAHSASVRSTIWL